MVTEETPTGQNPPESDNSSVTDLARMAEEVYAFEVSKGWQPNDNRFGESMALLHSEVSEALEAYRSHGLAEVASPAKHLPDCPLYQKTELTRGDLNRCVCGALPHPEGVGSELADVLIRLLSSARQYGVNLEYEYERKMAYNRTRAFRHGGKRL